MTPEVSIPEFSVVSGGAVHLALLGQEKEVVDLVEHAYCLHGAGSTVNPPSYFLRFPDAPANRIIALPAAVRAAGDDVGMAGLKWISSFPGNIGAGIPRASAVMVLNDLTTGYPVACLESSIISASRTAASAALAAVKLRRGGPVRLGFFGAGLIARYVHTYLVAAGVDVAGIAVHDHDPAGAAAFARYLAAADPAADVVVHEGPEALVRSSDLVVFATTAATPHVHDPSWFSHNPLVLHLSLRDLGPEVVLAAANVVDDVEHCLKASTSLHLVEQRTGTRDHVHATLYDVLTEAYRPPADRPVVFSPFGLGVLDLVLARHVHRRAVAEGTAVTVHDFFHERQRHAQG